MSNIGILNEKSIHCFLKSYLEPDPSFHEISVGPYIADIRNENQIIEIQTQQFKKLINKLDYYIKNNYHITIVYPLIESKLIYWVDAVSSEITSISKSSHKGVIQDIFKELYWIVDYLENDFVSLKIISLDVHSYKLLDGLGEKKKIKASKIDNVPVNINQIYEINSISDLKLFVPNSLPKEFTSSDFLKSCKCKKRWVGSGLKLLREHKIIKQIGKSRNSYVYERNF